MEAGSAIGGYQIVERIGSGGMAAVFKAYQPGLSRHVAIKVLPAIFADDQQFRERFQQEAVAIANLRHPNILVAFDYGEERDLIYLVSELVDGGTLAGQVGTPCPLAYTVQVLAPIASALDYAHSQDVLHRDVKPSNILIARDGTPVLSDFGLARIMSAPQRLTYAGMVVGTPEYMAPELGLREELKPSIDIYGLAVVAYELLTGKVPFAGETPMAVLLAHMHQPVPAPSSLNPALSAAVEAVLYRALAKSSAERYPTALAFIQALAQAGGLVPEELPAVLHTHTPVAFALAPGAAATPAAGMAAPAAGKEDPASPSVPVPEKAAAGTAVPPIWRLHTATTDTPVSLTRMLPTTRRALPGAALLVTVVAITMLALLVANAGRGQDSGRERALARTSTLAVARATATGKPTLPVRGTPTDLLRLAMISEESVDRLPAPLTATATRSPTVPPTATGTSSPSPVPPTVTTTATFTATPTPRPPTATPSPTVTPHRPSPTPSPSPTHPPATAAATRVSSPAVYPGRADRPRPAATEPHATPAQVHHRAPPASGRPHKARTRHTARPQTPGHQPRKPAHHAGRTVRSPVPPRHRTVHSPVPPRHHTVAHGHSRKPVRRSPVPKAHAHHRTGERTPHRARSQGHATVKHRGPTKHHRQPAARKPRRSAPSHAGRKPPHPVAHRTRTPTRRHAAHRAGKKAPIRITPSRRPHTRHGANGRPPTPRHLHLHTTVTRPHPSGHPNARSVMERVISRLLSAVWRQLQQLARLRH